MSGISKKEKKVKDKKIINNKKIKKEEKTEKKSPLNKFNILEVIVIMIITSIFGIAIGSAVTYLISPVGISAYNKNIKELVSVYDEVVDNYYGDIDEDELLEAGIKGMIDYLGDPHSNYIDSENSVEFNEKIEGEYIGLGAEISQNLKTKVLTITKVFENSPAEKSGLKADDIILMLDGKNTEELTVDEVANIIKSGEVGTKVELKVKRGEEDLIIEFERGIVELTSVTGEVIERDNKKIGLVTISVFAKNSHKQFKKVVENLQDQGIEYLIIDVRDNSGGYLTTVKSIADMFLDKKETIFIVKDKNSEEKQLAEKKKSITISTAVLINGGSASASEILAAALNENLDVPLVGLKTYGKGTVQTTKTLSSGATVKYTIQEWLTPKGNSIEEDGISPTVEVELSEEYYNNPTRENDNQLQKAIEVILKK